MRMFHDARFAECFVSVWHDIARRCKGRKRIYAYDLINEPFQRRPALPDGDYWSLQARAAREVRAIDPVTPIILESDGWDSPDAFSYMRALDLPDILYQAHLYTPHEYTHQGVGGRSTGAVYPNAEKGWDRDWLRRQLKPVRDFELRHDAKIYIGEFSAAVWAPGAEAYLADAISIFEDYGWDWSYHAFREWQGWSVEHAGADPQHVEPAADTPRKQVLLRGFSADTRVGKYL